MHHQFTPSDIERFWSRVDTSGDADACWVWTHGRYPFGYGLISIKGKNWSAHRMAWTIENGPIPVGISVCHTCDNPPCCNPAHLFLGNQLDNNRDKESKGRGYHGTSWNPAGEINPRSKLTDKQVVEARHRWADGGISKSQLAREYGVSSTMMSWVILQRNWTHLPSVEQLKHGHD